MIVYGDRIETVRSRDRIAAIAAALDAIAGEPPGIASHAALTDAFIALGQIVQGVADADRAVIGADGGSAAEAVLTAPLLDLARLLVASWDDLSASPARHRREGGNPFAAAVRDLRSAALIDPGAPAVPEQVELRRPEGYAFYAVYPEAYAEAARRLVLAGGARVVGIRSIGTGLAAVAAAVLAAPPPLTVRPVGHPFDRRIALTPEAEAALIDPAAHYVIVDEGPGLSGSSFAAVASYLEERGIPPARIAFLPSHGGEPGTHASPPARARWAAAQRPATAVDDLLPPARLAAWLEPLVGKVAEIADVSGGGWRTHLYTDEADWPAVDPTRERRKFLVRAGGGRWLVRFAGLGGEAARKLVRARLLARQGLVPDVRAALHGFLVEEWVDATPLARDTPDAAEFAGRYLAARVALPLAPGGGASLADLFAMARHNIAAALGEKAAARFAGRCPDLAMLQRRSRPIAVDGRCAPHEWLRLGDGRVVKADALDHDADHDLIGAQDLAWDVAGVGAEFDLSAAATERLIAVLSAAGGGGVDRGLLGFLAPCYLAFRLGSASLAADALGGWPQERERNRAAVARYAGKLRALL